MPNVLKLAALIVVAALGALLLRATYVAASRARPHAAPAVEQVRAAAADLPEGLLLRDSDLVWKSMPRDTVPPGALARGQVGIDDLKGHLLRHAVVAGTPLRRADVISPDDPDFLAAALAPGMRAISVAIDDVSGNAGLIQPGDYVDVLLTQQLNSPNGGAVEPDRSVEAETVANRVRVLAVGSVFQRGRDDALQPAAQSLSQPGSQAPSQSASPSHPNARARTVTFEVTPHTTQVIAVASHLGSLSLALRSFATRDRRPAGADAPAEPLAPPVWAGDVSRALRAAAPVREAHARVAAIPAPVIVYRGEKTGNAADAVSAATGTPGLPPLPAGPVPAVARPPGA